MEAPAGREVALTAAGPVSAEALTFAARDEAEASIAVARALTEPGVTARDANSAAPVGAKIDVAAQNCCVGADGQPAAWRPPCVAVGQNCHGSVFAAGR